MQREARGKAVDDLEAIAVEQGHMVVSALDHHEQIEWIGLPGGFGGPLGPSACFGARCADVGLGPMGTRFLRAVDPRGHSVDVGAAEGVTKGRHLRGRAAVGDDLDGILAFESLQAFRHQCRPHAPQALGTVAGRTVLGIEPMGRCARSRG